ncbi:tryptophan synthase subunit beta [Pectobacterium sp. B1J-3]|uniref:tryptophan synthase subunit beta n=1 Tax=Pectobacterium sp. B1J-3 TaxID=3385371 RepID=UPI0039058053
MLYIQRNSDGHLIRAEDAPFPEMTEELSRDAPEVIAWQKSLQQLRQSDLEMVRVLEDLIQVLMQKGLINITDFPQAAQLKLIGRAQAREALNGSLNKLIGDDEDKMF